MRLSDPATKLSPRWWDVSASLDPTALRQMEVVHRKTLVSLEKRHHAVAEMQTALDAWLLRYNRERPHQEHGMNARTPLQSRGARIGLPFQKEHGGFRSYPVTGP